MANAAALTRPATTRAAAFILGAATLLFWTALYLYVPFLPGHARSLGAGPTWIGVITGSYGLAQLVLRFPAGIWSDRLGRRKPFVLAGCAAAALSGAAFAVARGPGGLLAARTLAGVAATTWLAFTVLYTSYYPGDAGSAMAVIVFLNTLGVLVGQVAGPYLAGRLGTGGVFWLSAAVGVLSVALAAFAPDRRLPPRGAPRAAELLMVAGNPVVLTVSLLAAISQYLNLGGFIVFINDWAQQQLHATAADLGTLALYSGVPNALATLAGGTWLARRLGNRPVIVAGFVAAGISVALVPLTAGLPALYWLQAAGGLARGLTLPLLMSMALLAVPQEQGATAMGFFQATYSLGMTAGPVLTGLIAGSFGLSRGFWVMGVLALAGGICSYFTLRRS